MTVTFDCTFSKFPFWGWRKPRPVSRLRFQTSRCRLQMTRYRCVMSRSVCGHWTLENIIEMVRVVVSKGRSGVRQRVMNTKRKCYTGCETTKTGCSEGRCRSPGLHGGVSAHAPSTRENLVTNFSCEDLTSASLGCVALRKHIIHKYSSLFLFSIIHLE
jgi:hypothetical protein